MHFTNEQLISPSFSVSIHLHWSFGFFPWFDMVYQSFFNTDSVVSVDNADESNETIPKHNDMALELLQ